MPLHDPPGDRQAETHTAGRAGRRRVLLLLALASCRIQDPLAPEPVRVGSAERSDDLEARARDDLAAAEKLLQDLDRASLPEPRRERFLLLDGLVEEAREALDEGDSVRAAQLARKAATLARGLAGG